MATYIFDGKAGRPIDLATAKKWVAKYRASLKDPNDIRAHFFGSEIIKKILNEPGCVGIRIYYALDDSGKKQLLLVGTDATGGNLLPSTNTDSNGNTIADESGTCPPDCPPNDL
jgi:hypothetical protein